MRHFDLSTLVQIGTVLAVIICAAIAFTLIYLWVNKSLLATSDRLISRYSLRLGCLGLVLAVLAPFGASYLSGQEIFTRALLVVALGFMVLGHHLGQKTWPFPAAR